MTGHTTPHCEAVDPVVEAVAKYLHEMFHTSPYERWSCWINAEDVVNIVRQTTPDRVEIPTVVVGKWHPVHQHRWVWFNPPLTISEFRAARQDHLHTA